MSASTDIECYIASRCSTICPKIVPFVHILCEKCFFTLVNIKLDHILIISEPHAALNLYCEQGPLSKKYITCNWQSTVPLEQETVVLSNGAFKMEKEAKGRGIIFNGDELEYGESYQISIRDAAVTVTLKSRSYSILNFIFL